MQSFILGFTFCLGLIVAIGAQNAWVLSMSVRNNHPKTVATVCSIIDITLMALGILFLAWIKEKLYGVVPWLTLAGVILLIYLILQCGIRAIKGGQSLQTHELNNHDTVKTVAMRAASISLLNPHVYLDTVILVGNLGISQTQPWIFWLGGALASTLWFSSLAAFGTPLRKWLVSSARWRIFDTVIALIMTFATYKLLQNMDWVTLLSVFEYRMGQLSDYQSMFINSSF